MSNRESLKTRIRATATNLALKTVVTAAGRNSYLRGKIKDWLVGRVGGAYEAHSEHGASSHQRAYGLSLFPFLERLMVEKPSAMRGVVNFATSFAGDMRKRVEYRKAGLAAPITGVLDTTERCNLNCYGCYAASLRKGVDMPYDILKRLVHEMRDMGTTLITLSGGEPFLMERKERAITKIGEELRKRGGAALVYTNGTLIDKETAKRLGALQNIWPAFSEEGTDQLTKDRRGPRILDSLQRARALLDEQQVMYGFSVTATPDNADAIAKGSFFDQMVERGYSFGWVFIVQPIGRGAEWGKMVTGEQRYNIGERVTNLRLSGKYPIMVGDFWNDGAFAAGRNGGTADLGNACLAADRYFHIRTEQGEGLGRHLISVCVFAPIAAGSLADVASFSGNGSAPFTNLQDFLTNSTHFANLRKAKQAVHTPEAPCLLIDNPDVANQVWAQDAPQGEAFACSNMPKTYFNGEVEKLRRQRSEEWCNEWAPRLRKHQDNAVREFLKRF